MSHRFRVGGTRDFLKPDGTIGYGDIGLGLLDAAPRVEWEFLAEEARELRADQVGNYDALLVLGPRVTGSTLEGAERLAVVARFGVGYDSIDIAACTREAVLLTVTPDGVRRPVSVSAMTFLPALSHKLLIKDRLTRTGRWAEKLDHMGMGLTARTLGVVGVGNIGREVLALARPFEIHHLASDLYATPANAASVGAELVPLETLLAEADFVVICCALTTETHHLIDGSRLARMKPSAFHINVARGPIVDQAALTVALSERRIQGAGLDVFEQEPIDPDDPLLTLDNVILTPHAISWTDEGFREIGRSACGSILDVAAGRMPRHIVNREVEGNPRLWEKLQGIRTRGEGA
jgi:D-3-phosphoglycerate dehydrogenase